MRRKPILVVDLTPTLNLCQYSDTEFWLWDSTRSMNLAVRATSREEALLQAIEYYQRMLSSKEERLEILETKVNSFLTQFEGDNDE